MYSHFSFKSIALTVLDLDVVLFLSNDSVRPLQNKEIARVGRCRFYTPAVGMSDHCPCEGQVKL